MIEQMVDEEYLLIDSELFQIYQDVIKRIEDDGE